MPGERTRAYVERPRRIPPELVRDDALESCSLLASLLLYRVICAADDQGRLPGRPAYIKGVVVPLRDDVTTPKVERALEELVSAGFLIRYEAGGRLLVQVRSWWALQGSWGRRAYPSTYPPPPGWQDRVFGLGKSGDDSVPLPTDGEHLVSEVPTEREPLVSELPPPITSPTTSPSSSPSPTSHPMNLTKATPTPGPRRARETGTPARPAAAVLRDADMLLPRGVRPDRATPEETAAATRRRLGINAEDIPLRVGR